ncbi:VOC family protein [Streptomyces sp. NPDC006645]|uniref:VOC family protein n=1 Tax=unclassified Streptomyces TaxID=2593676 RepID=UPI0033A33AD2
MTLHWKLVVDTTDPHSQADFWAAALGYVVEDNSPLIERLLGIGAVPITQTVDAHGRRAWLDLTAVRHPDDPFDPDTGEGTGRRIVFQRVPESKAGESRVHLDVQAGEGRRPAEVARLEGLGATALYEANEPGGVWVAMTDPEGNEFRVQ